MTRPRQRRRTPSQQYPLATMIPYGPDDTFATKLVVSVVRNATDEAFALRTWTTSEADVRKDQAVGAEIAAFLREHGVAHTVSSDRILGCPHEEGIDYPMGRTCPRCPFWADKDRFTHERLAPPTATMSAAEVLDALASDDDARRHEALESADALRRELVEPLGAAIERALAHPADASKEEANLFSYGVYLLAKWREPTAYPWIVRWLSLPGEQPFEIGGDIATEDGARILAAVCDGDLEPIKALALDRNASEYGRGTGVAALALLAAWAEVPRAVVIELLDWLAREGLEREPGYVWESLALACVEIEALEVVPALRRAFDEALIDPMFMDRDVLDQIDASPGAILEETRSRMLPIADVEEATAWWDRGDGHAYDPDQNGYALEPYVAPPKIGRNEPCPCGSGKKHKKCCGR